MAPFFPSGSLSVGFETDAQVGVVKCDRNGHMDVTVDDAGHDELAAQIHHLSLKILQAGLVADVYEFAVLYRQGSGLRMVLVRSEDFCVFNDAVSFHGLSVLIIS